MNPKMENFSKILSKDHLQDESNKVAPVANEQLANIITIDNVDAIYSWGTASLEHRKFSENELQLRKCEFCKMYGISENSCLMLGVHETQDSLCLKFSSSFCNFHETIFSLEEKIEHSATNPNKLFTSIGEGYRCMEIECFFNLIAVHVEIPLGSYDRENEMKKLVSSVAGRIDALIESKQLIKFTSLINSEQRAMIGCWGPDYDTYSIAIYPSKLICESRKMPLLRTLYSSKRTDVRLINTSLNNVDLEKLLK